jgi:hypothetical protein
MPYRSKAEYLRNIHRWDIVQDFKHNGICLEQRARCNCCELVRVVYKVKQKCWRYFTNYERNGVVYPKDIVPECEPHSAVDVTQTKVKLQDHDNLRTSRIST